MRCYVHAKTGATEEAVAVCSRCGMGLCLEHAHDIAVEGTKLPEGSWTGATAQWMAIYCDRCASLYAQVFASHT